MNTGRWRRSVGRTSHVLRRRDESYELAARTRGADVSARQAGLAQAVLLQEPRLVQDGERVEREEHRLAERPKRHPDRGVEETDPRARTGPRWARVRSLSARSRCALRSRGLERRARRPRARDVWRTRRCVRSFQPSEARGRSVAEFFSAHAGASRFRSWAPSAQVKSSLYEQTV